MQLRDSYEREADGRVNSSLDKMSYGWSSLWIVKHIDCMDTVDLRSLNYANGKNPYRPISLFLEKW